MALTFFFLPSTKDMAATLGQSGASNNAIIYEYPEMSPTSTDPNMESCAAYGVISRENL